MNQSPPPPLPASFEPAWRCYLRAVISLLPAFAAWIFGSYFLQPRLEFFWEEAGLTGSRPQWLMDTSNVIRLNFRLIVAVLAAVFLILELRVRSWSHYRRPLIFSASVILNAGVIIWLLIMATCALLVAPISSQPR